MPIFSTNVFFIRHFPNIYPHILSSNKRNPPTNITQPKQTTQTKPRQTKLNQDKPNQNQTT